MKDGAAGGIPRTVGVEMRVVQLIEPVVVAVDDQDMPVTCIRRCRAAFDGRISRNGIGTGIAFVAVRGEDDANLALSAGDDDIGDPE